MNIMLIQCSLRLSVLLDQPPAGQNCACDRWRHCDRARDTAQTSFIDADGVTDRLAWPHVDSRQRAIRPTGVARIAIAPAR